MHAMSYLARQVMVHPQSIQRLSLTVGIFIFESCMPTQFLHTRIQDSNFEEEEKHYICSSRQGLY